MLISLASEVVIGVLNRFDSLCWCARRSGWFCQALSSLLLNEFSVGAETIWGVRLFQSFTTLNVKKCFRGAELLRSLVSLYW